MSFEWALPVGAAVVAIIGGLIAALTRSSKKQGAAETRVEAQQKVDAAAVKEANDRINEAEKVNEVDDRLNRDAEYSRSVRDRFTRD